MYFIETFRFIYRLSHDFNYFSFDEEINVYVYLTEYSCKSIHRLWNPDFITIHTCFDFFVFYIINNWSPFCFSSCIFLFISIDTYRKSITIITFTNREWIWFQYWVKITAVNLPLPFLFSVFRTSKHHP